MTVLSVLVAAVVAVVTVWTTTRDLALRRRMESVDRFLTVAATAQPRADRQTHVGTSEQLAAIELLADLGLSETLLRQAALVCCKAV